MLELPIEDPHSVTSTILSTFFRGKTSTRIRFVGSGTCNIVFGACVGDREVVVRFADNRYRSGEHAKEAWCIERAAEVGVQGPKVYGIGIAGNVSYMVQEYVPGERGDGLSITQNHVWRMLGEYASRIHAIDIHDYIEAESSGAEWAERKWKRYVEYGVESLTPLDRLMQLGVYSPDEQATIRTVFLRLQLKTYRFGLYHGDLSTRNTIVDLDGQITLFDWGCAGVGIVPHTDFSAILQEISPESSHFEAFISGYRLSRAEFAILLQEVREFRLLQAFDLVRWSIDQRPEELDSYVSSALAAWESYKGELPVSVQ
jgi:aminoglycoside phosphotransferase (APT) family kinase protein